MRTPSRRARSSMPAMLFGSIRCVFWCFANDGSFNFCAIPTSPFPATGSVKSTRRRRWRSLPETVVTSGNAVACVPTGTLRVPVAFAKAKSRLELAFSCTCVSSDAKSSIAQDSWGFMARPYDFGVKTWSERDCPQTDSTIRVGERKRLRSFATCRRAGPRQRPANVERKTLQILEFGVAPGGRIC